MKRHGRCSERPTRNKGPKNNGTRVANGRSRKQFTEQAKHTWRKGSGKKRRGIRRLPFGSAMYIYLYHSPDIPTEGQSVKAVVPTDYQSV